MLNLWLLLVLVLLFVGCNKEKKAWEYAKLKKQFYYYDEFLIEYPHSIFADSARFCIEQIFFKEALRINTFGYYEAYLEHYPKGHWRDKVDSCLEKLYMKRHPLYRHIQKIKILIKYTDNLESDDILPSKEMILELTDLAGLEVVEDDSKDFDATLIIQSEGRLSGDTYIIALGDGIGGYQYTGGYLSGIISLENSSNQPYKKTFDIHIPPLESIHQAYPKSFGNFKQIIGAPFMVEILKFMSDIFGTHILVSALRWGSDYEREGAALALREIKDKRTAKSLIAALREDHDSYVLENAALILGEIKDIRAIEPLIDEAEYWGGKISENAADALRKITGEDFGEDYNKWSSWWEHNKHKYLNNR